MSAQDVARQLYEAFSRRNGDAMARLYAPDATFSDAVFTNLDGPAAGAMWRMLCERGADLRITVVAVSGDERRARVRWNADYTFSTGRKVHNEVAATIDVVNGRIVAHRDEFSFRKWAAQALGLVGRLFGGTAFLHRKVQRTAMGGLVKWRAQHS